MGGGSFSREGEHFKFWSIKGPLIGGEALIQGFRVGVCAPWLKGFSFGTNGFVFTSCLTFD